MNRPSTHTAYRARSLPVLHALLVLGLLASASIAAVVSLETGCVAALLTITAWWTWQQPREAFLLLICIAPLLPLLKFTQTLGASTLIKDVIILTLVGRLVIVPLVTKQLPYRRNMLVAPLAALILWVAISTLRAEPVLLGILRARDIVLYVLLFAATLYLPWDRAFLRRALTWFVATTAVVALLGIYQWFAAADSAVLRFDPVRAVWIPRISSTFAHPSIFGHYLALIATLAFAAVATGTNKTYQRYAAVVGIMTLPFIYLTYSRAVWLGVIAAVIVMVLTLIARHRGVRLPNRKLLLGSGIGLLILMSIAIRFTPIGTFLQTGLDPAYRSNAIRLEFMARLIAPMTNTEAIIGRGLGEVVAQNFRTIDLNPADIATGQSRVVQVAKDQTLVDNQYLKTFVEMGLIGLLIYAWIFWRLIRHSIAIAQQTTTPITSQLLSLWSVGFVTFFIIQGFFIDIWEIFPTNAAIWVVAALLSQQSSQLDHLRSKRKL